MRSSRRLFANVTNSWVIQCTLSPAYFFCCVIYRFESAYYKLITCIRLIYYLDMCQTKMWTPPSGPLLDPFFDPLLDLLLDPHLDPFWIPIWTLWTPIWTPIFLQENMGSQFTLDENEIYLISEVKDKCKEWTNLHSVVPKITISRKE